MNSRYNDPGLFGDMPESALGHFFENRKLHGDIKLKLGPIRQEIVSGPAPKKGKPVSERLSLVTQTNFRRSNYIPTRGRRQYRGRGRGAAQRAHFQKGPANQKSQGQAPRNNQKKGGAKNSRGGKKGNPK